MYIVYVRMYVYIVRPRGAAVWHNHDLKSDQLISCVYVYIFRISFIYVSISFFVFPFTQLLRRLKNLGLYPGKYISEDPR